jgi:hypothetical protein
MSQRPDDLAWGEINLSLAILYIILFGMTLLLLGMEEDRDRLPEWYYHQNDPNYHWEPKR